MQSPPPLINFCFFYQHYIQAFESDFTWEIKIVLLLKILQSFFFFKCRTLVSVLKFIASLNLTTLMQIFLLRKQQQLLEKFKYYRIASRTVKTLQISTQGNHCLQFGILQDSFLKKLLKQKRNFMTHMLYSNFSLPNTVFWHHSICRFNSFSLMAFVI